jgi:hypothetical protein
MARARNIKPNFFKNPELGGLPFGARLLFTGLWVLADRKGRLEDRPARIAAEIFPYDRDIGVAEIDSWLTALAESSEKFIVRYSVAGTPFIQITNFLKHQSPHVKEQDSVIPAPGMYQTSTGLAPDEPSPGQWPAPPDSLIPSSLNPHSLNPDESQNLSPPLRGGGVRDSPPRRVPKHFTAVQAGWWTELRSRPLFRKGGETYEAGKYFGRVVTTGPQWQKLKQNVIAHEKLHPEELGTHSVCSFMTWVPPAD